MRNRYALAVIALAFLALSAGAQTPTPPSPPTKSADSAEQIAALKAQTEEMRRSEDRILSTVHWTLGTVVGVAFAIVAFGWWQAKRVYEKDLDRVRDEVLRSLEAQAQRGVSSISKEVRDELRESLNQIQASGIAHTMEKVSEIYLAAGLPTEAIMAALSMLSPGSDWERNAINKVLAALSAADTKGLNIDQQTLEDVRAQVRTLGISSKAVPHEDLTNVMTIVGRLATRAQDQSAPLPEPHSGTPKAPDR